MPPTSSAATSPSTAPTASGSPTSSSSPPGPGRRTSRSSPTPTAGSASPGRCAPTRPSSSCSRALDMAIWRREQMRAAGAIHHSDQGSQYTSFAFTRRLASEGLVGSMGTVGDALDNAMCESLIGTMKIEKLNRQPWRSVEDVRAAVFEWIETWYNRRRRHSSLDYLSPLEYESQHTTDTRSPTPNLSTEAGEAQGDDLTRGPSSERAFSQNALSTAPKPSTSRPACGFEDELPAVRSAACRGAGLRATGARSLRGQSHRCLTSPRPRRNGDAFSTGRSLERGYDRSVRRPTR